MEDGTIWSAETWQNIKNKFWGSSMLHLIGLVSDGGVHSRYDQLQKLMYHAVDDGCKRMRIHMLTDGRDVGDGTSVKFAAQLEDDLKAIQSKGCNARVASGGGRMYVTMDRYESNWSIVERGWDAHVLGRAPRTFTSHTEAIKTLREEGNNDQYLPPFVIVDADSNEPIGPVNDNDTVVLFNFRSDRMIEIAKAFEFNSFDRFNRKRVPSNLLFASMMLYDGDLVLPKNYLVPPPEISKPSGEWLVHNNVRTYAVAETQKFGHVTFFWNGNRSEYFDHNLETYHEVPSADVPFNQKPEMKAEEVTQAAIEALNSGKYDLIRINYANPDMVGHTGDLNAAIKAVEVMDGCLRKLIDAVNDANGRFIFTADHGNADDMVSRDKNGQPLYDGEGKPMPLTSHTLNRVPLVLGGSGLPSSAVLRKDVSNPGLANVTATMINMLGLKAPKDFEQSLITTTST